MNPGMLEHTLLHEDCLKNSEEFSSPESKRLRLDDGCNNKLNNTKSESKNSARWSYSNDTSLVEPEILEDMGVSILEQEVVNCESTNRLQSLEYTISPAISDNNKKFLINEASGFECQEDIYTNCSLETFNSERLEQDSYDLDDITMFGNMENESGYSSKVEIGNSSDHKEDLNTEVCNISIDNNDLDQFCLYRRKRKPSIIGEDKFNTLSDEIILMILKWLPKKCLVRSMLVCKRWCQIARDEVLWSRLDLGSKVLSKGTLEYILPRGVQILRLAQAEIADPIFCNIINDSYVSKLQYLDLSMAVISPDSLAALLYKCKYLKKLSLEKCIVNRSCCNAISKNTELEVLNLTMCEKVDVECIMDIMKLKCLTALNLAWCSLDNECITVLFKKMPSTITRLNVAGCRKTMVDDNVKDLSKRCPNMVELDLSDCAMLTMNTIHALLNFVHLEHLSLSRCYSIPQTAYMKLIQMPSLIYLNLYGLISELMLKSLQDNCHEPEINKFPYSSVARPTVGIRRTSIWGLRVRD